MAEKKVNDLKDGLVKNVYGFIKVGEFLKDTWKSITNYKGNDNKKQKWVILLFGILMLEIKKQNIYNPYQIEY